jgi:outer membrane receptor protein involved in Fe transport
VNNEASQAAFRLQDFFVMNARVSYAWRSVTLFLHGLNLTDARYETYGIFAFDPRTFDNAVFVMPAPGISVLGGVRVKFEGYY